MDITLRSSLISTADDCRRRMKYQYLDQVKTTAESANLAFGKAIDRVVNHYLRQITFGQPDIDPVQHFIESWRRTKSTTALIYTATQSPDQFEQTGVDLMKAFPQAWDDSGLQVALTASGEAMLAVYLKCLLGRFASLRVYLEGELDIVAYTREGALVVVDLKTAAQPHTLLYTRRSDQLTCYQILLDQDRVLGLPNLGGLGFFDLLKRKLSSRIEPPFFVPTRSEREIEEFKQKCFWLAEDIVRARFPRTSRMQFNSPCEMCAYANVCVDGDEEGLERPALPAAPAKTAALPASMPQP